MNDLWFNGSDDFGLIDEFELMLDLEEESTKKKFDPESCVHDWKEIGKSPYSGLPWINCSKCDLRKEDYDHDKKYNKPPPIKKEHKNVNLWGI